MSQETPERLQLAAIVTFDDQEAASFIANQGFEAAIQLLADAGLGQKVLILRPEENPATPGNMMLVTEQQVRVLADPDPTLGTIAPAAGLGAPYAANVQAASQGGDVAVILPDPVPEDYTLAVNVTQITPA